MPKVSVIIPFQNRIPWLIEAVDSVLAQTFQDFEIIIVDNGSTDVYQPPNDPRVRYIRQEDRGPAGGRNRGIDEARGEYVAFLDSDDLFVPLKLEKQVALMDARPNVLLSHTSYQRMTIEGDDLNVIESGAFSGRLRRLDSACQIATPTVMIRREALSGARRFEESLTFKEKENVPIGEDIILWTLFALTSNVRGINEPLTKVRMHGKNAVLDEEKQFVALVNLVKYTIEENPEFASLSRSTKSSIYLQVAYSFFGYGDFRNYLRYLKRSAIAWPFRIRVPGRNRHYMDRGSFSNLNGVQSVLEKNQDLTNTLSPWSLSLVHLDVGYLYLQQGDLKNYYKHLKRSVRAWPFNPLTHYAMTEVVVSKLLCEIRKLKKFRVRRT